jgi:hypothetical protein
MNRKSFLIHTDSLDILDELSYAQAGRLLNAMRAFQKGEPVELDSLLRIAFTPLKNQFIRDNEKYLAISERNKANGQKGGRPRHESENPKEPRKPSGLIGNPENPSEPDNDNDNNSDNVNNTYKEISQHEQSSRPRKNPITPYQRILEIYQENLNGNDDYNLIEVRELTKARKARMNEIWVKLGRDEQKLNSYFKWIYENRHDHTWLFGNNDRNWKGDIEYVCRIDTLAKAKEQRLGNWGSQH